MRKSVIIAAHNEGKSLRKTIESVQATTVRDPWEIVVIDDASTDDCAADLDLQFSNVRLERAPERRGVAATKHRGAELASGDVFVFLDGHCKPEPGALDGLAEIVRLSEFQAIAFPKIAALDPTTWENKHDQVGHGYQVRLDTMACRFMDLKRMRPHQLGSHTYYESACLQGCVLAVSRDVYQRLHGFDTGMQYWGSEDVDFGVRAWLMGHAILHDPELMVGHRFQSSFSNYSAPLDHILANQMRMARKVLTNRHWEEWLVQYGARHVAKEWLGAWEVFCESRDTVEAERDYLMANQVHDIDWYAERFMLVWPLVPNAPLVSDGVEKEDEEEEDEDEDDDVPFGDPSPIVPRSPSPTPTPPPPGGSRKGSVVLQGITH